MLFIKRGIDFFTLGSDRPVRRLVAYYLVLAVIVGILTYFFPVVDRVIGIIGLDTAAAGSGVLEDGLASDTIRGFAGEFSPRLEFAVSTLVILLGTLVLMLPVSWVYMSTRYNKGHDQQVAQTLIFLPLVVAGIVLVVQNSLALAFSLAGVVAAVRFRTTLRDTRDVVFIFLAIAVGFAAGVQNLIVAALVSFVFNFVLILTWRYDFGRSVLQPTAASQWSEPLHELAVRGVGGKVPDRDMVMALDQKQAMALAERFARVREILGPQGRKPRYNAILSITTETLTAAQTKVDAALDAITGRWRLDEVVTNAGKPDELYYLVRIRKSTSKDDVLTAVRTAAANAILNATIQLAMVGADDAKGKP
ncbi:MAG: DUF4956 domain-containing protein [Candidatus Krumholzibacteriia bacterium]